MKSVKRKNKKTSISQDDFANIKNQILQSAKKAQIAYEKYFNEIVKISDDWRDPSDEIRSLFSGLEYFKT